MSVANPRVVYASRGGETRVHTEVRSIPVVFVPGFMGSRLTDPKNDALVWNPTGGPIGATPGGFAVDFKVLQQITHTLVPDETHPYAKRSDHERVKHVRHFYQVLTDYYGDCVLGLAAMETPKMKRFGLRTRVYCAGYDWRQDIARSALRLAATVEEALRETRERKVILVGHSTGGIVARYYCRAMGGESKVHQVILLASPTMGAPDAFLQIKMGMTGLYPTEIRDAVDRIVDGPEDPEAIYQLSESALRTANQVVDAVSAQARLVTTSEQGVMAGIKGWLGDLYIAFSLGAGRWLSRDESIGFMRALPGVYGLLPNGLFCARYPQWLSFDPLATGVAPSGFVVPFPTLTDGAVAALGASSDGIASAAGREGTRVRESIERALHGDDASYTSPRASRNAMPLVELLRRTFSGDFEDPRMIPAWLCVAETLGRMMLDARSVRALYDDVFTGFMDRPALRGVSAANLALFHRLDAALTLDHEDVPPQTPGAILKSALLPGLEVVLRGVAYPLSALGEGVGDAIAEAKMRLTVPEHALSPTQRVARREAREAEDARQEAEMESLLERERAARRPRVYMHPCTVNVHCDDLQTGATMVLMPRVVRSRDDSNVVPFSSLPNFLASTAVWQSDTAGNPFADLALGDQRVPRFSSNPPAELMSAPFVADITLCGLNHAMLPKILAELGDLGGAFGDGMTDDAMEVDAQDRRQRSGANPHFKSAFETAVDDHLEAWWRS
jgi:pimeloyl-ACP methyl ester carboxylesterase